MNTITLQGCIRDIQPSHTINNIEYDQANLIVPRKGGKEDVITLKFKKYSNKYKEGDQVSLTGNIRSFSQQISNTQNKVSLYVFTYFDIPETVANNYFEIDGRICKIHPLRTTKNGKQNIQLILANNLIIEDSNQKLNSYLPCVGWGRVAKELSKLSVNDKVKLIGELHSREYKKMLNETEFEFRIAHELVIQAIERDYE